MKPVTEVAVVRAQSDAQRPVTPRTTNSPRRAASSDDMERSARARAPSEAVPAAPSLFPPRSTSLSRPAPFDMAERATAAARRGDVGALKTALAALPPEAVHTLRDEQQATLLAQVAECARKPVAAMQYLIDQGVDLDARDQWSETPLHKLATRGPDFFDAFTLLLEINSPGRRRVNPNSANHMGRTVLEEILKSWRYGPQSALRALITRGVDLNQPGQNGIVPLFMVARYSKRPAPVVKLILDAYQGDPKRRADPDRLSVLPPKPHLKEVRFGTPLVGLGTYAADPLAAMVLLVRAGASVKGARALLGTVYWQGIPIRGPEHVDHVLELADDQAKKPDDMALSFSGAVPRAPKAELNDPPLDSESRDIWFAAAKGRLDLTNFYLVYRPETIAQPQHVFGGGVQRYPLAIAAINHHRHVVRLILDNLPDLRRSSNNPSFDVDVADSSHKTALMYAIEEDSHLIVQMLLQHGADPTLQGPMMPRRSLSAFKKPFAQERRYPNVLEFAIAKNRAQCVALILTWNAERKHSAFDVAALRERLAKDGNRDVRDTVERFHKMSHITTSKPAPQAKHNKLHRA